MTRSKAVLALLACAVLAPAAARAELLVNPEAESGNLTGWTDALGNGFDVWFVGSPPTYSGFWCFWGGANGPAGARTNELRQDVSVVGLASGIDTGLSLGIFTGRARSSATATARMVVEYRNTGGTVLGTFDTGPMAPPNSWLLAQDSRAVPIGTRSVRVRLIGVRTSGTSTDAYFDALSLTIEQPVSAHAATWGRIKRLFR